MGFDRARHSPVIAELAYRDDSVEWFEQLRGRRWPVFLDSGHPHIAQGRYDILSADPKALVIANGRETEVRSASGVCITRDDPLQALKLALGAARSGVPELPFSGGAIGYFGYDLGRRWNALPERLAPGARQPDMAVGVYDWALVVDHQRQRTCLIAPDAAVLDMQRRRLETASPLASAHYRTLSGVAPDIDRNAYLRAFERVMDYLRAGDCYQVNLAQRFTVAAEGDPWRAYRLLRTLNPAPFAAYLDTPSGQILCSSPERFLKMRDGLVETRPIKGTRPRGDDPEADRDLAERLCNSPKDRAENLMIVDLLRNDLGRVCAIGSVRVPRLFEIESYARVHHLVSTVTGRLAPGCDALALLRACLPGGSITGAPKRRAMQIIDELEPQPRGVYCGAIGYLGFDGALDTNIAIRTLVHAGRQTQLWAGGGIVIDSDPEAEYRETWHKAAPLIETLERLRG